MSKYHAAKPSAKAFGAGYAPLCGSRGFDRYKTVTVNAATWNATATDKRCKKCAASLAPPPTNS